jgi:class 3 adenylate cyclase
MALLFAATYPDRVASLVVTNTAPRGTPAPDYPFGLPPEVIATFGQQLEADWGREDGSFPAIAWPSRAGDAEFRRWVARVQRSVMTPRRAAHLWRMELEVDIRHTLPLIQAPTLVVATSGSALIPPDNARYLADQIADARLLLLEGAGAFGYLDDLDRYVAAIEEHITGEHREVEPDRVLATVLFTDIVGSTELAASLGDRRWRELLDRHDRTARRVVGQFSGRLVKTTGDGILATFDGPARAVRAAASLHGELSGAGVHIRAGLHAGEVEVRDDDVGGIAVHIASRVMSMAEPGEVLVSSTVKGLVAGSGLAFTDRGSHELKGIPDQWQLHALAE